MTLGRYRTAPTRRSPIDLDAPATLGNVDRLPQTLEIDGTFFAPCAYLVADDINPATGAWASRHDASKVLSVAGAGAAPTYGNATAIDNSSVNYKAQQYHQAANTTWGQPTTGDFAIECVLRVDPSGGGGRMVFSTYNGTGIALYVNPTQVVVLVYRASVDKCTEVITTSLGHYLHVFIGVDASEKLYFYANGVYQSSKAVVAYGGSIVGGVLTLSAHPSGINNGSSEVISLGLWDLPTNPFPGVLKNRTYFDRIARERFAIVAGIQDRRQGAHLFYRVTPATLDRYVSSTERRLFRVSNGWPRVGSRKDATGLLVRQYLPEPQATNQITYSEDLTQVGSWTRSELTAVTAAAAAGPDGALTLNGLVATAVNTSHYIRQTYTTPATLHAVSWFGRKGDKDWILANVTSVSNVYAYWNCNTGAWGTIGAGVTAYAAEDWGGGLYRAWLIFTGNATAIQYQFYSAPSDGSTNFTGDAATVNTYLGCVQVEAVTEHFPSTYIPTLAAAVVRNRDELSYAVRLPVVSNLADLSQALTISGTDYAPTAYLLADDIDPVTGEWLSRSTYHANILTDGDMEAADTAYWSVGNSATITKETGTPHGGTRCIRCARNGVNNPYFVKTGVTIIGKVYRLRGYVRSDGTAIPTVYDSGAVLLFTGTTSTLWQAFDVTYTAVGVAPYFWVSTSTGTTYCEWDDLVLESEAKLYYVGAGTNPTPRWDAISRANTTVRYWASNYHAAADTTWGQIGDNDGVIESLFMSMDGNTISTRASGSLLGYGIGVSSGAPSFIVGDGTDYVSQTAGPASNVGTLVHFMAFIDKSDKVYFVVNGIYYGATASTAAIGNSTGGALSLGALSGGISPTAGQPALFAVYNLPTNPLPGAATNQAVCTAIARARFDRIFQMQALRMDCEILHPNVNRQAQPAFAGLSINQSDYISIMGETSDFGSSSGAYNNTWAWRPADGTVGSTDIHDNVARKLSIAARRNLARYIENNAVVGTDASCEIPPSQIRLQIGMWANNGFQSGCGVGRVRLSRRDR